MVYNDAARPSDHRIASSGVYDNVFYDNESVTFPTVSGTAAVTYEVRDYYGNIVASGPFSGTGPLDLGVLPLGFYKLFFPRLTPLAAPYLNAGGEATFAVLRSTSPCKSRPAASTPPASVDRLGNGFDIPLRGMVGAGPVRHQIRLDATNYAADKAGVLADIAYENTYRNNDTARPFKQIVAFPDYDNSGTQNTNLTNAVQALVAAGVVWFEGINEPASTVNDPTGVNLTQFQAFASTVHAAHASAKVLGPCPIELRGDYTTDSGGQARWMWRVLNGLSSPSNVDVISFHNYNNGQGDLAQMRAALAGMVASLTSLGQHTKPRFNTEFGSAFASSNGVGDHRQQAKNIMLDLHVCEQYGIPKEQTYLFYDRSHGFWGFPSWWIHCEGTEAMPTALVPLMRVWAEELWGKTYSARLNFGSEDNLWVGSKFTGTDGTSLVTLQSSGHTGTLNLSVTGATTVTTVDPWGNLTNRAVESGVVSVPVSELPTYVRIPSGANATSVPADWGVETFRLQSSTASASTNTSTAALAMDNTVDGSTADWIGTASFPAWWRVDFPKLTRFNRVTIFCSTPLNSTCTLVDFDIQALQSGVWVTVATVTEPTTQKLWTSYKQAGATYVESYWSRRNQWSVRLPAAVSGNAVRIYIRSVSYGGSATPEAYNQNPGIGVGNQIGLSGPQVPSLREVFCHLNEYDLAGKSTPNAPLVAIA